MTIGKMLFVAFGVLFIVWLIEYRYSEKALAREFGRRMGGV